MKNILLLEPNYKNKYPPIGLMKIATFHKNILHDYVRFAKGTLPDEMAHTKWDRVYVTSLFTFEWAETIKAINYAKKITNSIDKVFVGGIAATLMPDQIFQETGIHPICGSLNTLKTINLPGEESIDDLIPDYSMLEDISNQYVYPFFDAYFLSATKGCGMNCGFCAVQTLEPKYVPYLNIKTKIHLIDELYGQKKDLLLMDNNVLRSAQFNRIIDDILEAGFEKGADFINPRTGKKAQRFVDFNQGLDANFLTTEKAKRLGEIALRPARIAFDHIEDQRKYEDAIRLCAEYGTSELSNYVLYNSENFGGKGHQYQADSPEDLYDRMKITLELKEDINKSLPEDKKVSIFSFPMRYIPLTARERGYVGSKWNPKFLRSFQCMLIPTQGKGVGNRSFFEADFGKNSEEFIRFLCMPEKLLSARGHFAVGGRGRVGETIDQISDRRKTWSENQLRLSEWNKLFNLLGNETKEFIEIIKDNEYLPEKFFSCRTELQKKIYLHYLTNPRLLSLLGLLQQKSPTHDLVHSYLTLEFPLICNGLVRYLVSSTTQHQYTFKNFVDFFHEVGLQMIIDELELIDFDADNQLKIWSKICRESNLLSVDFELIRIYTRFVTVGVLPENMHNLARNSIKELDMGKLSSILFEYFESFKNRCEKLIEGEKGEYSLFQSNQIICSEISLKLQQTRIKPE